MSDGLLLWLAMIGGGLVTFISRAVFLLSGERFHPGPRFRALLAYVPPAVLAALIAPEVLVRNGEFAFDPASPRLWAALLAGVVAYFTRSVLATISVGLAALWLLQAWLG